MLFCKHEWEKVTDTVIRALPEELLDRITSIHGMGVALLKTRHVVILTCKKCGKIYKSVETFSGSR